MEGHAGFAESPHRPLSRCRPELGIYLVAIIPSVGLLALA